MRIALAYVSAFVVAVLTLTAFTGAQDSAPTPIDPPPLVVTAAPSGVPACAYVFAGPPGWVLSKPDGDQSGAFCRPSGGGLGWSPDHNRGRFVLIVRGTYPVSGGDSAVEDQVAVEVTVPED